MSWISLNKLQNIIPEFVDERLIPSAPPAIKWLLGGSTYLVLSKIDELIKQYSPLLKQFDLINEKNQLNIERAKGFINSAFNKSGQVTLYGFTFNFSDGEFLVNLLEKYKDD